MENKINIAELLKDCPTGMELDCTMYDNLYFDSLDTDYNGIIICYTIIAGTKTSFSFTKYGTFNNHMGAKCVIFPKGKTTWEGFHRPFKSGDIVAFDNTYSGRLEISIFKNKKENNTLSACYLILRGNELYLEKDMCYVTRFATEEEKKKLFDAIEANGYKWNPKNKTLEKLIKPKFKVGDRVKTIYGDFQYDIKELTDTHYTLVDVEYKYEYTEPIIEDKNWELVPNKFNINTLIPFESKVLVRGCNSQEWVGDIFTRYDNKSFDNFFFVTLGGSSWKQCIPYNDNTKHLLGTTDDCDEYFKNW